MTTLCRYILPAGRHCEQPAVRATHFCRHHGEIKRVTRRPPRKKYDFTYIIPFVYAEDRAGIQFNLHLVTQALMEGRIDVRTANAYTNNIRAAATNLRQGPLVEPDCNNIVKRVILTPEGDEIAPPREVLEKDESPIHYKDCPCQSCAEQYRGAAPEQHHADCQCGLCGETSDQRSPVSDQDQPQPSTNGCHPEAQRSVAEGPASGFGCHPERTGAPSERSLLAGVETGVPDTRDVRVTGLGSEGPASSQPATDLGAPSLEPAATKGGNHESSPGDKQASVTKRGASAQALRSADTLSLIQKAPNYHHYLHGDEIAQHEAQHAARARAALEAGLEPPEHKPWDTSIRAAERERKREEWKAGIDQRRKESIDKWNAEHPDQPKEFKPFLTWGEERDLKLAEMKRLREQDEARLREQAAPAS